MKLSILWFALVVLLLATLTMATEDNKADKKEDKKESKQKDQPDMQAMMKKMPMHAGK